MLSLGACRVLVVAGSPRRCWPRWPRCASGARSHCTPRFSRGRAQGHCELPRLRHVFPAAVEVHSAVCAARVLHVQTWFVWLCLREQNIQPYAPLSIATLLLLPALQRAVSECSRACTPLALAAGVLGDISPHGAPSVQMDESKRCSACGRVTVSVGANDEPFCCCSCNIGYARSRGNPTSRKKYFIMHAMHDAIYGHMDRAIWPSASDGSISGASTMCIDCCDWRCVCQGCWFTSLHCFFSPHASAYGRA
jgi:hypothetical protein